MPGPLRARTAVAVLGGGRAGRVVAMLLAGLAGLLLLVLLPLILLAGVFGGVQQACQQGAVGPSGSPRFPAGSGDWTATAYGPPWADGNGIGVTAAGIDLRPARRAFVVAVDPSVIDLGSYVHVEPNPHGDDDIAFVAGDTGDAIRGRIVDVYDWRGRVSQYAWGRRSVDVTPAARPGTGNILDQTPTPVAHVAPADVDAACAGLTDDGGPLQLSPGQRARVLPDGSATAPAEAPPEIKRYIAAGNTIHEKPYVYGGGHGASLKTVQSAYDCSSSTSFALHRAGMLDEWPRTSGQLRTWGAPGPGRWLTLYSNDGHVFSIVAGISFNTAHYGATIPAGSGPRWSTDTTGQLANDSFVVRHWPGL